VELTLPRPVPWPPRSTGLLEPPPGALEAVSPIWGHFTPSRAAHRKSTKDRTVPALVVIVFFVVLAALNRRK
jgi:hypothetical protein